MLVPVETDLCKTLCLDDVFTVDMSGRYGIQHIVGFVVRRTVQPKFAHGDISLPEMEHSIRNDNRGNTFGAEKAAIAVGQVG